MQEYTQSPAERNPQEQRAYEMTGHTGLAVYRALVARAHSDDNAHVTNRELQEITGASESTVRRRLQQLTRYRLITPLRLDRGRGKVPTYHISEAPEKVSEKVSQKVSLPMEKVSQKVSEKVSQKVSSPIYSINSINSKDTINSSRNVTAREGDFSFLSLAALTASPRIQRYAQQKGLTYLLLRRAIIELQHKWRASGPPMSSSNAESRLIAFLEANNKPGGKFEQWRKEAPAEMAGIVPH